MNIKNLKIYSDNLLKNNKIRLVALSLVGTSLFTIGGCSSNNSNKNESNNKISIIEMIDCLAKVDGLTTIDEDMKEPIIRSNGKICDINILYDEYNKAVSSYNAYQANTALYYMGITSLKSLIASTYDIPFNEINNLDVGMCQTRVLNENNYSHDYDYPIRFTYNGVLYTILPKDKLARELCYCINRTEIHALPFVSEFHTIQDAYDIINASLLFEGKKEDIINNMAGENILYFGNIIFTYDNKKLDAYSDHKNNNSVLNKIKVVKKN